MLTDNTFDTGSMFVYHIYQQENLLVLELDDAGSLCRVGLPSCEKLCPRICILLHNHAIECRPCTSQKDFPKFAAVSHKLKRAPQDYGDQLFVRIQDAALAK
jgi:hypothetical protein